MARINLLKDFYTIITNYHNNNIPLLEMDDVAINSHGYFDYLFQNNIQHLK